MRGHTSVSQLEWTSPLVRSRGYDAVRPWVWTRRHGATSLVSVPLEFSKGRTGSKEALLLMISDEYSVHFSPTESNPNKIRKQSRMLSRKMLHKITTPHFLISCWVAYAWLDICRIHLYVRNNHLCTNMSHVRFNLTVLIRAMRKTNTTLYIVY